eukprot:m.224419 g.224419  ORF g.224419 m.224419 type:complete len:1058 (+) comp17288_c0_seq2:1-3174(+)
MAYLEKQNIVHRDLTARNVLVNEDYVAKVAGFGMAKDLAISGVLNSGTKVPFKWTAPEVLKLKVSTAKSDVWSFGITMWEIYSFGRAPYPKMSNKEVVEEVPKGQRMENPEECPEELYTTIMRPCWELEPLKRPTFHRLTKNFAGLSADVPDTLPRLPMAATQLSPRDDAKIQAEFVTKDALAAISAGKVPYNGTNNISVGPGASGKTQTRYSITGKGMMTERASTAGGDQEQLLIQLKQGQMVAFDIVEQSVDLLERAAFYCREHSEELDSRPSNGLQQLAELANLSNNSHHQALALHLELQQDQLLLAQMSRLPPALPSADASVLEAEPLYETIVASDAMPAQVPKSTQVRHLGLVKGDAKTDLSRQLSMLVKQDNDGTKNSNHLSGIYTLFSDMGGQPQFWALVANFLRNNSIITVFFRQDELLSVIKDGASLYSDSHMDGLQELMVWLDAVSAATSQGPVMIVGTFADKVTRQADRQLISDTLRQLLKDREHPLLVEEPSRLVFPNDKGNLIFFSIDNTKGLGDPGVQAYKQRMQELAGASPSVSMPVPVGLLRFQDAITALTRPATPDQLPVCQELRARFAHADNQGLCYLRLDDARAVYHACLEGLDEPAEEKNFRVYLDFLHMQGVLSHDNAAALEDLVVIDPMWLLKTFTRVIRDIRLHKFPEDVRLPGAGEKALFKHGILYLDMLSYLWTMHDPTLRMELVGLMLQSGLAVAMAFGTSKVNALLIPSMLPFKPDAKQMKEVELSREQMECHSIILAAYTGGSLIKRGSIDHAELAARVSLPVGLFEQLAGRLVRRAQVYQEHFTMPVASRTFAAVRIKGLLVELELLPEARVIKVNMYAKNATGLASQVEQALAFVIEHYYKSLKYKVLVPFEGETFLALRDLLKHYQEHPHDPFSVGLMSLSPAALLARYSSLLPIRSTSGQYHVFISYRWSDPDASPKFDSEMVEQLADAFSLQAVGMQGERLSVFYDRQSLSMGSEINLEFMQAMARSKVICPLVTAHALTRMCTEQSRVDNVLCEWWLALALLDMHAGTKRVRIVPIFAGGQAS